MFAALLTILLAAPVVAQPGALVVKSLDCPPVYGDPIIRQDFERCKPGEAVLRDDRQPDHWVIRTKDWPTPLLNSIGKPPDLTYDPQLKGVYDIYIGTRATDFTVSMSLRLGSENEWTVVTSPRETRELHRDWEYCFRREVPMDGEKIVLRCLGPAVYVEYLKFVPIVSGKVRARVATDHVVIASEKGKHFAFPGLARLADGSLGVVFREGTAHIDPSGKVSMCRSTDGGRTWSPRWTVYDNPKIDERDPGICQHSSGSLVVSFSSDGAQTIRSTDGGKTWDKPAPAPVFSPHGPTELPDGRLYWCGIVNEFGINHVKIATSADLGCTWQADITTAESLPYHQPWVREFWDEPHTLPLSGGRWLCLYRVDKDGYLYQNRSGDAAKSFTIPARTRMWGCPPYLLHLKDGRIVALYGYRRPPFGIRACVSRDDGATWDMDNEIVLRADGGHGDLGYPVAIELEPGLVFAVYYHNHGGPECSIEGTYFRP
jgi:hypothetical protein